MVLFALVVAAGCGGGTSTAISNGGGSPEQAKVIGTIAVGFPSWAIAVNPTNNKIYLTDFGSEGNDGICQSCYCPGVNGSLAVIDGTTQSVTTTGFSYTYSNPLNLAVNPANDRLYVASRVFYTVSVTCGYWGRLGVFDAGTIVQTADAPLSFEPLSAVIAVNQMTGHVYVTDWYDASVTVFDDGGNVLATITLPTRPSGVAVNMATNKIYVATDCTFSGCSSDNITVIDEASNAVISTITDPNIIWPVAVGVNASTNSIYVVNGRGCVTCSNPNNIAVIDGASDSVTGTIPVGTNPASVTVNPETNFIYVANMGGNGDPGSDPGSVSVIDGETNVATNLTDTNLRSPWGIAVNTATNKIYVANSRTSNVTVIDGAHN